MSKSYGRKGKARKVEADEISYKGKDPNAALLSDTNHPTGMKNCPDWGEIYRVFANSEFPEEDEDSSVFDNIKKSEIHLIASRPAILPYNDMVQWIISHVDLGSASVVNDAGTTIASLQPDAISRMYKLRKPEVLLNKQFLDTFKTEKPNLLTVIKKWWHDEEDFTEKNSRLYPVQYFRYPFRLVAAMLCRLYGEENCIQFKREWTPLVHHVTEKGQVFNWAHILSFNLLNAIKIVKEASGSKNPGFYMSAFLVDAVCSSNSFPLMGWTWNPDMPPVHIYCGKLWASNFKKHFYEICDNFMAPLHSLVFNKPAPRLSIEARNTVRSIGDWYIQEFYTYIRILGHTSAPHLLPKYVPDWLVLREIAYQTMVEGVTALLSFHSKKTWPKFPIKVGIFTLLNGRHALKEAAAIKELCLCTGTLRRHDPKGFIEEHIKIVGLSPSYQHDSTPNDFIYQGVTSYEEVLSKITDSQEQANMHAVQEVQRKLAIAEREKMLAEEEEQERLKKQREAYKKDERMKRAKEADEQLMREEETTEVTIIEKEKTKKEIEVTSVEQEKPEEAGKASTEPVEEVVDNPIQSIIVVPPPIDAGTLVVPAGADPPSSSLELKRTDEADDAVVSLGDYFFSKSRKGVIKKPAKRPRLEEASSKEPLDQLMFWSITDKDPQKIASKTASVLGAFAEANFATVSDLNATIDRYKVQVASLENQLAQERVLMEDQYKQQVTQITEQHEAQMKSLQEQHLQGLEKLKKEHEGIVCQVKTLQEKIQLFNSQLEERSKRTLDPTVFKEEALIANENLRSAQKRFFTKLDEVQQCHDDLIRISDQVKLQLEARKVAQNAFDQLVDWQKLYKEAPESIPRLDQREKGKAQLLLDSWKIVCDEINDDITISTKACYNLWNSVDDILEEFGMPVMEELSQAAPSKLRVADVDQKRDTSTELIRQLTEVNKDVLNSFLVSPIRLATLSDDYVQQLGKDLKREVIEKICVSELQLEQMKYARISHILEVHEMWKPYRDG